MEVGGCARGNLHRVGSPENKGEEADAAVEGLGLGVLVHDRATALDANVENNGEVGDASNGVPAPDLGASGAEGGEQASEDHDDISANGDENVSTVEATHQSEIQEEERSGKSPLLYGISC